MKIIKITEGSERKDNEKNSPNFDGDKFYND